MTCSAESVKIAAAFTLAHTHSASASPIYSGFSCSCQKVGACFQELQVRKSWHCNLMMLILDEIGWIWIGVLHTESNLFFFIWHWAAIENVNESHINFPSDLENFKMTCEKVSYYVNTAYRWFPWKWLLCRQWNICNWKCKIAILVQSLLICICLSL